MRAAALVALSLVACDARLQRVSADLLVEPSALVFPATATGDTRTLPVALMNASRAPLKLHVSSGAPFALELDVELSGGESRQVPVPFAPAAEGAAAGVLVVSGDVEAAVALTGDAVAPAQCSTSEPCRRVQRDPATNTCVEENAADGSACTSQNACLAGGVCVGGVCAGTPVSCDDHDACTVDACEPSGGCQHVATVCPAPADKCHVARCDPKTGCASEPAPDGTACGPSDCTTAHVCMAGTCRAMAVPDGYACGDASPCQAKGRCSAGTCNQPAATSLQLSWSHPMPYNGVDFRGVVDPSGNLYWVECEAVRGVNPCELVSYSPDGLRRFGVTVPTLTTITGVTHLAAGGRIFVAGRGASVAAFSETGALLWTKPAGGSSSLDGMVADRSGRLYVAEHFQGETDSWSLIRYDPGASVGIARKLGGTPRGLTLDASGNVYFVVSDTSLPLPMGAAAPAHHLVSLAPSGATRFTLSFMWRDAPHAVFNGELLMNSGEVRSTLDGAVKPGAYRDWSRGDLAALMSATGRYRWVDDECCPACDCAGSLALQGWAVGGTQPRFTWASFGTSASRVSQPQLLSDGSVLFASQVQGGTDVKLRALDSSGAQTFACTIGSASLGMGATRRWGGATALTQGRWAVLEHTSCPSCIHDPPPVLRVYAVPGLTVAPSGWTGVGGSPGRNGQPR